MYLPSSIKTGIAAFAATVAVVSAQAAPVRYLGNDGTSNGTVDATKAPVLKRNAFTSALTSYRTETFESLTAGTVPSVSSTLSLSSIGGTLSQGTYTVQTGKIENEKNPIDPITGDPTFPGRFNTSPDPAGSTASKWWDTAREFTVALDGLHNAFGFYGSDFGDFDGTLTIQRFSGSSAVGSAIALGDGSGNAAGTFPGVNGSLLFFGFTDDTAKFDRLVFQVSQLDPNATSRFDRLGFDDLIVGDLADSSGGGGTAPEPGTLALVALALAGVRFGHKVRKPA